MILGMVGKKLWTLKTVPRVKHFIWLIFKCRLPITNHLYRLNLGPGLPCSLCGLNKETIDHLFITCPKIQTVWNMLNLQVNKLIQFSNSFASGAWLITSYNYSKHVVSLIAASA